MNLDNTGFGKTDINSKLNDQIFFNPHESIGVGTVVGLGSTAFSTLGDVNKSSFNSNTKYIFTKSSICYKSKSYSNKTCVVMRITVSDDDGVTTFNIPEIWKYSRCLYN